MALKYVLDGQEEYDALPEQIRDHYIEEHGQFSLSVDGATKRETELGVKVAEFRENNVQLLKDKITLSGQVEELQSKFSNVDPQIYKKLISDQVKLEKKDAKVVTNSDLSSQIQEAVKNAVQPIQAQLNESKERETLAKSGLERSTFTSLINKAAIDAGVRTEAVDDVLGRATTAGFQLHEGQARMLQDGMVKFSSDRPDQPYTVSEWLVSLQRDGGGHLFKPSISTGDQDQSGSDVRLKSGTLRDPSVHQFAKNIEAIASGKVTVSRSANRGE
tara:strand:+ start:1354 stop:2175 length:822 start_codon:yes stop_codon:yes gene_type:complete